MQQVLQKEQLPQSRSEQPCSHVTYSHAALVAMQSAQAVTAWSPVGACSLQTWHHELESSCSHFCIAGYPTWC